MYVDNALAMAADMLLSKVDEVARIGAFGKSTSARGLLECPFALHRFDI
jgi:hypothetical protein